MIIKLGELLGRGGYAKVYRALDPSTSAPLALAVKRSRTSQRIRRSHLLHEARVIHLLEGHTAIPRAVAYGHLVKFEYLVIDLCGRTIDEEMRAQGGCMPESLVAKIAVQMISALQFIHSRGFVHRDIKPSNILLGLDTPPTLRIIDYGLARPPCSEGASTELRDPIKTRCQIPGTVKWASLNTHFGHGPTARDDVESLAYTLLYLLRGNLPWDSCTTGIHGTIFGSMKHVRHKKQQWSGARLGSNFSKEFGELLDYARSCNASDALDYERLLTGFKRLIGDTFDIDSTIAPMPTKPTRGLTPSAGPPPVSRGDIVYIQFLPQLTIEGYTGPAFDPSHWKDPSIHGAEWETEKRPAVVLDAPSKENSGYVKVAALRRKVDSDKAGCDSSLSTVGVAPQSSSGARWPWDDTIAYSIGKVESFRCLPDQPVLTSYWSITASACDELVQQLNGPLYKKTDRFGHDIKIRISKIPLERKFALLHPLENPIAPGVQWYNTHGWLDELVQALRVRLREDGRDWSADGALSKINVRFNPEDGIEDSNTDPWMTEWTPLLARSLSVTSGQGGRGGENALDAGILPVEKVYYGVESSEM